ncbi:MAG: D-alanine--D-alanine ligase [Candidatus Eremiobacteraeota bacterium]|nr:D-alanine--D-alanine ligase [Candidatus Eremiobacteraeota bacterium]
MANKPAIAVIAGGRSAEREISLQTGAGVSAALQDLGYPCTTLDADERFIETLAQMRPDAVFNALHGGAGEDGTVQALLDWLQVPYQGSGSRASAIAMDKWITKALARSLDIPTPRGVLLDASGDAAARPPEAIGLPCVVKPRAEGSAVGVSIVHFAERWEDAVEEASAFGPWVVVEEYIEGREFTVAILGERALPVIEITPHDDFYTYHAKYTPGASTHVVPAHVPAGAAAGMQRHALALHRALGCRDYSRVDVLMTVANSSYVLECNTLPGLTPLSLFPEAAAADGIPYNAVIEQLIQAALSRAAVKAS